MQEEVSIEEEEDEEDYSTESSSSSISSEEEEISRTLLSTSLSEITNISKIMAERVEYETTERTTQMNGDKNRKSFVRKLREMLRMNDEFRKEFAKQFRSASQKDTLITDLSQGREPLLTTQL